MAPKETHTTARPVRIPKEDWDAFGALVGDRERSRLIREFIAWYLRRPKATLPKRPDAAIHRSDGKVVAVEVKSTHRPPGH
ncbi:hypothetical protein [Streptomyces resistomycificus]|uniref:Uncharacterized protein n=1 Tax=Streptomyces resistomycificus TaxID=67356 RepID=A0A0L8L524_9ACTN|nr:hypothetical protein [Streptomyces resistomycificus]KOG33323.1 hypothetical protein ADK37_23380 [Streptomyces resistomycificus]KUN99530.1 hypothetical protein AQJ84_11320 [Streptomyces resistomycificus]